MSGSVPGGGPKAEPNLTPILDMVFQLITFFMLVINFKAAELDLTLKLPVLASAKPLPENSELKMVVLNVQICTKCPVSGCDAFATLVREMDSTDTKVVGYHLHCERGHDSPLPSGAITNGRAALSVYGHLLCKESRGKDLPSIEQYIKQEADLSLLAAKPPMTHDDVVQGGKELPDFVVIRADATCRYGAVDYIIRTCQEQGFRRFALKTLHDVNK